LKSRIWISLAFIFFLGPLATVHAQEEQPEGPVYIVQAGDSLWGIAQRFGVSMDDLANQNGITDPNQLVVGTRLVIPGLEGLEGVLVTQTVPYGETLDSFSRRLKAPVELLAHLNHFSSPDELYAGATLVYPEREEGSGVSGRRALLRGDQSLMELAILEGVNPWTVILANDLQAHWDALPGDILYLQGVQEDGPGAFPAMITGLQVNTLPLVQGHTLTVKVTASEDVSLTGAIGDSDLHFFVDDQGDYVALQGIYAMTTPGLYPLSLEGALSDGTKFGHAQLVLILDGNYPFDRPLTVDPETIDQEVTGPEDELWAQAVATFTPERYWDDVFQIPSPLPQDYCLETGDCWSSRFGNRRSYNGSAYDSFHTGLDIVGQVGREIFAPAPGEVVYTGSLIVRGNATVINHGWGVYTGYAHQSEILVEVGDWVETGDLIGLVGETGRVEGPHLHWEVLVGGVQVDPLDWLEDIYP
jgi:murein DD-endopeptidase MepM/ murein hydrolase activator NlpD